MTIKSPLPASADMPRAALIAGPTASGKSALAVALARSLNAAGHNAVIINADASQVYADLAILSARPTAAEMDGIAHRLFGHIDGAQAHNAAAWSAEASAAVTAAHAGRAIPILVGGTGLYIRTLLDGIAPVPPIDDDLRTAIRALPVAEAYARLTSADPHGAVRLKPQDKTRIARALEVAEGTGTPLHVWQQQRVGGIGDRLALTPLVLLPPRDWLRARCDMRLAAMFAGGAAAEVTALLARKLDPDLPVMRAIGVPEVAAWLRGELDQAAALTFAQAATRQYAKRQYNWFRNQVPDHWQRFTSSLNHVDVDDLVIKLRDDLLTA